MNPSEIFGGTWASIFEGRNMNPVGSQVLLNEFSSGRIGDTPLLGTYGNGLFDGILERVNCPNGYTQVIRFSANFTTHAAGQVCLKINGKVVTRQWTTWSCDGFRRIISGEYFTFQDFVMKPTLNYEVGHEVGLNLQVGFSRLPRDWAPNQGTTTIEPAGPHHPSGACPRKCPYLFICLQSFPRFGSRMDGRWPRTRQKRKRCSMKMSSSQESLTWFHGGM
jgi:hypothetical protein